MEGRKLNLKRTARQEEGVDINYLGERADCDKAVKPFYLHSLRNDAVRKSLA